MCLMTALSNTSVLLLINDQLSDNNRFIISIVFRFSIITSSIWMTIMTSYLLNKVYGLVNTKSKRTNLMFHIVAYSKIFILRLTKLIIVVKLI